MVAGWPGVGSTALADPTNALAPSVKLHNKKSEDCTCLTPIIDEAPRARDLRTRPSCIPCVALATALGPPVFASQVGDCFSLPLICRVNLRGPRFASQAAIALAAQSCRQWHLPKPGAS